MRRRKIVGISIAAVLVGGAGCAGDDTKTESKKDADNVVDLGGDTYVPDTYVPDTYVPDTAVADTSVADTADTSVPDVADTIDTFEVSCPETPHVVVCADFDLTATGSKWDGATSTITLVLKAPPGVPIASGTLTYDVTHATGVTDRKTAPATITGSTISFVLTVASDATNVVLVAVNVTDACGATSKPGVDINLSSAPDAGPLGPGSFYCGS